MTTTEEGGSSTECRNSVCKSFQVEYIDFVLSLTGLHMNVFCFSCVCCVVVSSLCVLF